MHVETQFGTSRIDVEPADLASHGNTKNLVQTTFCWCEVKHEPKTYSYNNNPPTPAYQGERAQRRLAKANNIEHTRTHKSTTHTTNTQAFLGTLLGRKSRCISKPIRGAKWAPKLQKHLFFIGSGRDVWHWRSPQRRSKNGVLELARPCCFPVPEPAFLGTLLGPKSRCISKPIRGAKWAPKLQKHLFFIGSGRDVWHWRSPHVLELARPCWFEVRNEPQLQKHLFFIGSGRDVWHWRSPQRMSKNGVLELARPRCFPVPEPAFLGTLLGRKSRCISKPIRGAKWVPKLQKHLFFI